MSLPHQPFRHFFLAATLLVAVPTVLAHGGEQHDAAPAIPAAAAAALAGESASRAAATSPDFELVAALEDGRLVLYLDRYATGEPVAGARVEVESGVFRGVAMPAGPGVYALDGKSFAAPGRHALAVTVEAGDLADLLSATLETRPPAPAPVPNVRARAEWIVWGAAVVGLLLAGGALVLARRLRRHRSH